MAGRNIPPQLPFVQLLQSQEAHARTQLADWMYRVSALLAGGVSAEGGEGEGKGIKSIVRDPATGVTTITYTDGTTDEFTIPPGTPGKPGVGVKSIERDPATGVMTITYTDDMSVMFTVPDGNGIKTVVRNDATGVVTVTYDDDTMDTFDLADGADAVYFTQPVVEIPVRAIGDTISEAIGFNPDPASAELTLADGDARTTITVSGDVSATGVEVTLSGRNASDFEVL